MTKRGLYERVDTAIQGEEGVGIPELVELIREVNPTGVPFLSAAERDFRYGLKSQMQSILIREFSEFVRITGAQFNDVCLSINGRSACHVRIDTLDSDAQAWVLAQLKARLQDHQEPESDDAANTETTVNSQQVNSFRIASESRIQEIQEELQDREAATPSILRALSRFRAASDNSPAGRLRDVVFGGKSTSGADSTFDAGVSSLDTDQSALVRRVAERHCLTLVDGDFGTGKTHAAAYAARALTECGMTVVWVAASKSGASAIIQSGLGRQIDMTDVVAGGIALRAGTCSVVSFEDVESAAFQKPIPYLVVDDAHHIDSNRLFWLLAQCRVAVILGNSDAATSNGIFRSLSADRPDLRVALNRQYRSANASNEKAAGPAGVELLDCSGFGSLIETDHGALDPDQALIVIGELSCLLKNPAKPRIAVYSDSQAQREHLQAIWRRQASADVIWIETPRDLIGAEYDHVLANIMSPKPGSADDLMLETILSRSRNATVVVTDTAAVHQLGTLAGVISSLYSSGAVRSGWEVRA